MPTHPLAAFFQIDERADGCYITVTREKRDALRIDDILKAVAAAQVVNFDEAEFRGIFQRARGAPERLGPAFEYYNPRVENYLQLALTDMKATLRISSLCIAEGIPVSANAVLYFMKNRRGMRHGLLPGIIEQAVSQAKYDADLVVAVGTPPVNGADARIHFEIELKPTSKPQVRPDGTVDYKEIRTFIQAAKDQVIARKIPPGPGKPGITVTGREIPAAPGKDVPLPAGANTVVSEDGQLLLAAKSGVVRREGTLVAVGEVLAVERDVDYSVGNVKYSGELVIKGDVKAGFAVEAEGNIDIHGVVESSNVSSRTGTVFVRGGIIGKGQARIYGKEGIHAGFAQDAKLETEGTLTILKHCLHCECICATFDSASRHSSVVGGSIRATKEIEVHQLGNAQGAETHAILIDKKKMLAQEKIKELEELKAKIAEKLTPLAKQVQSKAAILKMAGEAATERQRAEMKKWIEDLNGLNLKAKYVQQKIDEITRAMEQPTEHTGFIRVTADIHPGVVLTLYEVNKVLRERMTGKCFRLAAEGVVS